MVKTEKSCQPVGYGSVLAVGGDPGPAAAGPAAARPEVATAAHGAGPWRLARLQCGFDLRVRATPGDPTGRGRRAAGGAPSAADVGVSGLSSVGNVAGRRARVY